ncbi:MAG: Uncharacterized MFS-type transporter, partial [uncultured Craurococcus sp.]
GSPPCFLAAQAFRLPDALAGDARQQYRRLVAEHRRRLADDQPLPLPLHGRPGAGRDHAAGLPARPAGRCAGRHRRPAPLPDRRAGLGAADGGDPRRADGDGCDRALGAAGADLRHRHRQRDELPGLGRHDQRAGAARGSGRRHRAQRHRLQPGARGGAGARRLRHRRRGPGGGLRAECGRLPGADPGTDLLAPDRGAAADAEGAPALRHAGRDALRLGEPGDAGGDPQGLRLLPLHRGGLGAAAALRPAAIGARAAGLRADARGDGPLRRRRRLRPAGAARAARPERHGVLGLDPRSRLHGGAGRRASLGDGGARDAALRRGLDRRGQHPLRRGAAGRAGLGAGAGDRHLPAQLLRGDGAGLGPGGVARRQLQRAARSRPGGGGLRHRRRAGPALADRQPGDERRAGHGRRHAAAGGAGGGAARPARRGLGPGDGGGALPGRPVPAPRLPRRHAGGSARAAALRRGQLEPLRGCRPSGALGGALDGRQLDRAPARGAAADRGRPSRPGPRRPAPLRRGRGAGGVALPQREPV